MIVGGHAGLHAGSESAERRVRGRCCKWRAQPPPGQYLAPGCEGDRPMCGISAYVSTCKAHSSLAKCLQGMLLAAIPFIIRNVTCRHVCVGGASNTGGAVLRHFFDDEQIAALTPRLRPDVPAGLDYYPLLRPGASLQGLADCLQ